MASIIAKSIEFVRSADQITKVKIVFDDEKMIDTFCRRMLGFEAEDYAVVIAPSSTGGRHGWLFTRDRFSQDVVNIEYASE